MMMMMMVIVHDAELLMMGVGGRCGRRTCHSDAICIQTASRSYRCRCRDGFYGNGKICIGTLYFQSASCRQQLPAHFELSLQYLNT